MMSNLRMCSSWGVSDGSGRAGGIRPLTGDRAAGQCQQMGIAANWLSDTEENVLSILSLPRPKAGARGISSLV